MKTLNACLLGLLLLPSPALADYLTGIRQVPLLTNDLVYDAAEGTIYASVPGSVGASGNSLTPIDPGTGTIGAGIFVGSEPTRMAISDNDQFIYVALGGANAVSRFNLATHTTDLQFSLGNDPFSGPRFAGDLAVVPGNPHAVVVSEFHPNVSPSFAGLVVFDNGVPRPNAYRGFEGGNSIAFAGSPTQLYAINNETTEFGFRRFNIDNSGITLQDVTNGLVPSFFTTIKGSNSLVYANTGRVIDPTALTVVGTYAGVPNGSFEAIDPALNRAYFISSDGVLRVYDEAHFTLLDTFTIPGVVGSTDSLITWGTDGLAFGTSSGQVFLINALVPEPASLVMLGTGVLGVIGYAWSRRKRASA